MLANHSKSDVASGENAFEVQRRAMKTFKDLKNESGRNNLDSLVFDYDRHDVGVWNLKVHKYLLERGIAGPLEILSEGAQAGAQVHNRGRSTKSAQYTAQSDAREGQGVESNRQA
jgi:hypothetical protein